MFKGRLLQELLLVSWNLVKHDGGGGRRRGRGERVGGGGMGGGFQSTVLCEVRHTIVVKIWDECLFGQKRVNLATPPPLSPTGGTILSATLQEEVCSKFCVSAFCPRLGQC